MHVAQAVHNLRRGSQTLISRSRYREERINLFKAVTRPLTLQYSRPCARRIIRRAIKRKLYDTSRDNAL